VEVIVGATAKKDRSEGARNMPGSAAAPARESGRETATERLEARVSRGQKRFFQHAAELKGQTLTDFMIGTLQEAAVRTVEEHNVLKLTLEDQRIFVKALMNPPSPNEALKRAAERYRRTVVQ
jgi:uncharacterized protein (DUF1778 family)